MPKFSVSQFFSSLSNVFTKPRPQSRAEPHNGSSFFTFQSTGEVIRAEQCLKKAGYTVAVMGPPPWLQSGCDMVLVCDGVKEPAIRRLLTQAHVPPEAVYPMTDGMLAPVSLVQITPLGEWFMVRAANMKITVCLRDGVIVNVSGGGCPDVPYLANLLLGQSITKTDEPRLHGQTLCSYALQKAFVEARDFWQKHHARETQTEKNASLGGIRHA